MMDGSRQNEQDEEWAEAFKLLAGITGGIVMVGFIVLGLIGGLIYLAVS